MAVRDGLRLIPKDAAALEALSQQVTCWARTDTGRLDSRVGINTCYAKHIWVPAEVCTEYGAPTFTSQGAAITCPAEGDGQVPYYILASDVPPLNTADCTPLNQLPTPTGLTPTPGDAQVDLAWQPVNGATGYAVQFRETGATDWTPGPTPTGTTTTVPGLTNAQPYEFQVKATATGVEDSAWSATVTATPIAGG